jgi:hypothetical protein
VAHEANPLLHPSILELSDDGLEPGDLRVSGGIRIEIGGAIGGRSRRIHANILRNSRWARLASDPWEATILLVTAAIIAAFALLFVVVGLPLALLLLKSGEDWIAALADALPLGLVLVTVGVTAWSWVGWPGAIVCLAGFVALLAVAVLRRSELPKLRDAARSHSPWYVVTAWVLVIALTVVLRLHDVNNTPWVSDMGAYVNWANEFARTGVLNASWPPIFPVLLALSAAAFGTAHTTTVVGVSGVILLLVIARTLQRLGVPQEVVFGAALLVALHPDLVWYSTFPSSESISAPLFIVWIALMHRGITASGHQLGVVLGAQVLLTIALSLLRGSGALLVLPVLVVTLLVFAVREWRPSAARMTLALATAAFGAGVGYWYGIEKIPRYFVGAQIRGLLPDSLTNLLDRLGLFTATPLVFVLALLPGILIGVLGFWLERRPVPVVDAPATQARPSRWPLVVGVLLALVLTAGIVLDFVVSSTVAGILLRLGLWLMVGTVAALVLLFRRLWDLATTTLVLILGVTIIMFIGLHTIRLGVDRTHSIYLYWDRYLVSEVLPASILLSALVVAALVPVLRRRTATIAIAGVVGVAVAVVPAVGPVTLQSQDTYMAGAYDFTKDLINLRPDATDPVLWSGTSKASVWFFPNTWMGFALPMRRSFGLDVVNSSQKKYNFGPDEILTEAKILNYFGCRPGVRQFVIYETQSGGPSLDQRLAGSSITLEPLGSETSSISLLAQPPVNGWTHAKITVRAWLATAPASVTPTAVCSVPAPAK